MKKFITTLATLAVATAFAAAEEPKPAAPAETPAAADAKPKRDPEQNFKKLDTNSDSALSLEEFKQNALGKRDPAKAEAQFKARDKDADGKLNLEEFKARPGKKAAK
jgi:hypothetical protein